VVAIRSVVVVQSRCWAFWARRRRSRSRRPSRSPVSWSTVRSSIAAYGAQLFAHTTSAPSKASAIESVTVKDPPEAWAALAATSRGAASRS